MRSHRAARVGLVLGAGGLAGKAFHAGVLAALEEATGWTPDQADTVVGTSAGASYAVFSRHAITGTQLYRFITEGAAEPGSPLEAFEPIWASLGELPGLSVRTFLGVPPAYAVARVPRALRGRPGISALAATAVRPGELDVTHYVSPLNVLWGEDWPGTATLVTAVRRRDGRRVVFDGAPRSGRDGVARPVDVASAVAASSAIPGYFAPVTVAGERFVDGGLHSPTNADVLAGRGLDLVLVSAPMSTRRRSWAVPAGQPVRRLARVLLDRELAQLQREGTEVVVFNPGAAEQRVMGVDLMDVDRAADIAAVTRTAVMSRLVRGRARPALLTLGR